MFKRKSKELVEIKKVNKMLEKILETERCISQSSGCYTMVMSVVPTSDVWEIARKYGFLKE